MFPEEVLDQVPPLVGVAVELCQEAEVGFRRDGRLNLALPPTFIQRKRDAEFEFCLFGRFGQRGLARSFASRAAASPFAG